MRTENRFLLKTGTMLLGFFTAFSCTGFSQIQPDAKWNTWIVKPISQTEMFKNPSDEQTAKELKTVKDMMAKRTERIMHQIAYWDAGAPSYRWNQIGYRLAGPELFTKKDGGKFWYSPMAWMNMAIYDATVATLKIKKDHQRKRPYEVDGTIKPTVMVAQNSSYPCEYSATAAAASTVLSYFFPELTDSMMNLAKEASQSRVYAGVQFPSDVADGWKLGEQVAKEVIERSKKQGYEMAWKGTIPKDPKLWTGEYPVGALTSGFTPLVLKTGNQFRPAAPPDFAKEMEEMKNFKQNLNSIYQAFYWAHASGLDVWTDIASQKIFEYHLDKDALTAARIYTLLHVALHDAAIAIMDAKYAYWGIRPNQYDKDFKPLLGFTPPFPGYPSGHATASSVAATILSYFFPGDAEAFKRIARECADSRFYAGIHFPTDNKVGLEMGEKMAKYIIDNWESKLMASK